MLVDFNIFVVIICIFSGVYFELVVEVVCVGKYVIVEKLFEIIFKCCDWIIWVCVDVGVVFVIIFLLWFYELLCLMKKVVE